MDAKSLAAQEIAFRPPPNAFEYSQAGRLAAIHDIGSHAELSARAQADPAWFWAAAAEDVGLEWMTPFEQALDLSDGLAFPRFFRGGRLNWCDYAVDKWIRRGRGDAEAICWEGDGGARRTLTYRDLHVQITAAAGALRANGVGAGDVVGLILPMIPEAAVAVLAAARIGAVVAPMFSGYGAEAIRERLIDAGAKLLVTCDAFPRRGRLVPVKDIVDKAVAETASVTTTLVVRRSDADVSMRPGRDLWWDEACAAAEPVAEAVPMGPQDPCLLLYTSGSTGRPKGCIHTHAGLPFQCAQEARHGLNVSEKTRILWVTDMGWVMGAYLLTAALSNGGTAIFFEGTPDWPGPDRLWDVTSASRATVLGISPTVVRALMAHGSESVKRHDLSALQAIGSTGEPWNPEPWWWCFRHVGGGRCPIVNLTGGTEVGGSILSGGTYLPLKPASFSAPTLGMSADVVDSVGRSVRGQTGELVVRGPWPGMTRGFKEGTQRYLRDYWGRFDGMWVQGDLAFVDDDGFWYLLGRSDDTLKLAGKRLGPAEVESVLVRHPQVVEAAAVGVPDAVKGQALVCFVVPSDSAVTGDLPAQLITAVSEALGKPMAPKEVHLVAGLPKTRSGKVMRRIARSAYLGEHFGDLSSLDNEDVLGGWPVGRTSR